MKRVRTQSVGVYTRKLESRRHAGRQDVAFDITYKKHGKLIWERVGLASEGCNVKLAQHIRGERLMALRHGDTLPREKKPAPFFKDVAEKFLEWGKVNRTGAGRADQSRYDVWLKERFATKRMDEITPLDVEDLKSAMLREGKSLMTFNHVFDLIRAIYGKARDWELYDGESPTRKVKKGKVDNGRVRYLTIEQAKELLESLKINNRKLGVAYLEDPQLHDIALTALHAGLRASEIFGLRGSDVNMTDDTLFICDTKSDRNRMVPLTADLKAMFEGRIAKLASPGDLIFTTKDGKPITEVSDAFEDCVERMGLNEGITDRRQRISFHSLRHTFASWLALQGVSLQSIATLLGHSDIKMTQRYAHLSPDFQRRSIDRLEAAFNKGSFNGYGC